MLYKIQFLTCYKTMKSMDKAAQIAMLPDYEMYCVDLSEGARVCLRLVLL